MIELRYTGAGNSNESQTIASRSLGGYVSTSRVPNDDFGNIFSEISLLAKQFKKREARLIALVNTSTTDYGSLVATFKLDPNADCNYKVAFVTSAQDDDGNYFEKLNSQRELPAYANFEDVVDGKLLSIGTLDANSVLGMWLIREMKESYTAPKDCDTLYAEKDQEPNTSEELEFTLSYGDASVSVSTSVSTSISKSV